MTNKNKYRSGFSFIPSANLFFIYQRTTASFDIPTSYFHDLYEDYHVGILGGFKVNLKCSNRFSIHFQLIVGPTIHYNHSSSYDYSYNIYPTQNYSHSYTKYEFGGFPLFQFIYRL